MSDADYLLALRLQEQFNNEADNVEVIFDQHKKK